MKLALAVVFVAASRLSFSDITDEDCCSLKILEDTITSTFGGANVSENYILQSIRNSCKGT